MFDHILNILFTNNLMSVKINLIDFYNELNFYIDLKLILS